MSQYYGTGRRKRSVARVFLSKGDGEITVNGKPMSEYFNRETDIQSVISPFKILGQENAFNAKVTVKGGGVTGQAHAVRHGVARALLLADEEITIPELLVKAAANEAAKKRAAEEAAREDNEMSMSSAPSAVASSSTEDGEEEFTVRKFLKRAGYLTRDARKKERRKFGLARKARKRKQFSKR